MASGHPLRNVVRKQFHLVEIDPTASDADSGERAPEVMRRQLCPSVRGNAPHCVARILYMATLAPRREYV